MEEINKMIHEHNYDHKGFLDQEDFIQLLAKFRILQNKQIEKDTKEAFVALGGQ